jgi:hypothetical protein
VEEIHNFHHYFTWFLERKYIFTSQGVFGAIFKFILEVLRATLKKFKFKLS